MLEHGYLVKKKVCVAQSSGFKNLALKSAWFWRGPCGWDDSNEKCVWIREVT